MKKVRVFVDSYRCKWCEACVVEMPSVFFYNEMTGKADVAVPEMERTPELERVMALCPTKCIQAVEV
jgi:ferredoxin